MKKLFAVAIAAATAAFTVCASNPEAARAEGGLSGSSCGVAYNTVIPQEASWRQATTLPTATGDVAPTSTSREAEITRRADLMKEEVLGEGQFQAHGGDIPPIEYIPGDGVRWSYLFHTDGVSGQPTKLAISGVGSTGVLKGTFLAPVSGHNGRPNAIRWSTSDTFSVRWDVSSDAAGSQWANRGYGSGESAAGKTLVENAKSLGVITEQEMDIPLVRGRVVRILYYRSDRLPARGQFHDGGGGSPGGYWEGRILELVWDGT